MKADAFHHLADLLADLHDEDYLLDASVEDVYDATGRVVITLEFDDEPYEEPIALVDEAGDLGPRQRIPDSAPEADSDEDLRSYQAPPQLRERMTYVEDDDDEADVDVDVDESIEESSFDGDASASIDEALAEDEEAAVDHASEDEDDADADLDVDVEEEADADADADVDADAEDESAGSKSAADIPVDDQAYVLEWGRFGPPLGGTYHLNEACQTLNRSDVDREIAPLPWSRSELGDDEDWEVCGHCAKNPGDASDGDVVLDHTSTDDLERAYEEADGNIKQASEMFGVGYTTVYRKMREHDVHESVNQGIETNDDAEDDAESDVDVDVDEEAGDEGEDTESGSEEDAESHAGAASRRDDEPIPDSDSAPEPATSDDATENGNDDADALGDVEDGESDPTGALDETDVEPVRFTDYQAEDGKTGIECQHCGSQLTPEFVKVFEPEEQEGDGPRVCPNCDDLVRDNFGEIREKRNQPRGSEADA